MQNMSRRARRGTMPWRDRFGRALRMVSALVLAFPMLLMGTSPVTAAGGSLNVSATTPDNPTPGAWTLAKSSDPESGGTVSPGLRIIYKLTATNNSAAAVDDVVVQDDLADVLDDSSFISFTGDDDGRASRDGNMITWDVGTLEARSTRTVLYEIVVDNDARGVTIRNVVTGTGEVPPAECTIDEPCATEQVTDPAGVWSISTSSDPASGSTVAPGSTITYTLTATNASENPVGDIVVTDDLVDVLDNASFGSFIGNDGRRAKRDGNTIRWNVGLLWGELGGDSTRTISYTVTVDEDAYNATLRNVVAGTGGVPPVGCTTDEPCGTEHATPLMGEWSMSKSSNPASGAVVLPGSSITYTLTATNESDAPVHNVVISDDLSDVLDDAAFGSFTADDSGLAAREGNTITADVGTLEANSTRTVSYTVTVNEDAYGATLRNVTTGAGEVSPADCTTDEPCTTEHTSPPAREWSMSKSSDPVSGAVVRPGDVITYTLTAANASASAVRDVVVTDNLSDVLDDATFGSFTGDDNGLAARDGEAITWNVGLLEANTTRTVSYTATVNEDALGGTLRNLATGTGEVPPVACMTEEPCATENPMPGAWAVAKTSDPATGSFVAPGSTITYTLTATNDSDSPVRDVLISDDLSDVLDNAAFVAFIDDNDGRATREGNVLTWNVGTLEANTTLSVAYTVNVDSDARGITLSNVVTGAGGVPPTQCTANEPCKTEHTTPTESGLAITGGMITLIALPIALALVVGGAVLVIARRRRLAVDVD